MCYLARTDCFRVQWKRFLMKLHFKRAAYAEFSLLLLILPFVNFCYCCSPGLLNFRTSCLVQHWHSLGWIITWDAKTSTSHSSLFFFLIPIFSVFKQGSLVNQLTEQPEKKINSPSMFVFQAAESETWLQDMCGLLSHLSCTQSRGHSSEQRSRETLKLGIRAKFFPFNTIMPHINLNDSLRMILWPS